MGDHVSGRQWTRFSCRLSSAACGHHASDTDIFVVTKVAGETFVEENVSRDRFDASKSIQMRGSDEHSYVVTTIFFLPT